ncbi:BNR-4 repeat-containing protein [Kitasatospora sp. NPDC004240]
MGILRRSAVLGRRAAATALAALLCLAAPATPAGAAPADPVTSSAPVTTIATDGYSQDATGFYAQQTVWDQAVGTYYTFYLADGGVTRAVAYDLATKTYGATSPVATVGTNYHYYASAAVDAQGYIHLFHGMHASNAVYSKSKRPHDITEWDTKTVPVDRGTYPYLFADGSTVTVFFRAGGNSTYGDKIQMAKSTDAGANWTVTTIVDLNDPAGHNGNYLTVDRSENGTFHIAMSQRRTETNTSSDFHNILYFRSADGGTTWTKRDGTAYTLPVSRAQADVAYSGQYVFASSIDSTPAGDPYILISRETSAADFFEHAELLMAHYANGSWGYTTVSPETEHKYHARLRVTSAGGFEVYVPKEASGDRHALVRYTSPDGVTFTPQILANECGMDVRAPQIPREKNAPAQIVNFHSTKTVASIDLADISATAGANLALRGTATADSTNDPAYPATDINDGSAESGCRWTSADTTAQHWARITWQQPQTVKKAVVHTGWQLTAPQYPIANWRLQYLDGANQWTDIPGTAVTGNTQTTVTQTFATAVTTKAIRLRELELLAP